MPSVFILTVALMALTTAIRAVDFDNFTYPGDLLALEGNHPPITLHHGKYMSAVDSTGEREECGHHKIVYGDVMGDGTEEAAVTLWCNTGGSGYFTALYVYALKHGQPTLIETLAGGDRGDHGIFQVRIEHGMLMVVRGDVTEAVCCPDHFAETTYRWNGTSFVAIHLRRLKGSADQFNG